MRARLRRLLDRIVEPRIPGRHTTGTPTTQPQFGFGIDEWANSAWAEIARRHGIEDDR